MTGSQEIRRRGLAVLETAAVFLPDGPAAVTAVRAQLAAMDPETAVRVATFLAVAALHGREDLPAWLVDVRERVAGAAEVDALEYLWGAS